MPMDKNRPRTPRFSGGGDVWRLRIEGPSPSGACPALGRRHVAYRPISILAIGRGAVAYWMNLVIDQPLARPTRL